MSVECVSLFLMSNRCEDYPCCGHTDDLPCDWVYTEAAADYDRMHFSCDHDAGVCDVHPDHDDEHDYDHDDTNAHGVPWCYGCDDYATCGDYEPDGADHERWETTTPDAVYATDED